MGGGPSGGGVDAMADRPGIKESKFEGLRFGVPGFGGPKFGGFDGMTGEPARFDGPRFVGVDGWPSCATLTVVGSTASQKSGGISAMIPERFGGPKLGGFDAMPGEPARIGGPRFVGVNGRPLCPTLPVVGVTASKKVPAAPTTPVRSDSLK